MKGSKLWNDSLIILVNIIPAEWRLNLRKMRGGKKEEMPEGRPLQWSWGVIVWFQLWCGKDMNTRSNVFCVCAKKGMRGSEK